MSGSSIPTPLAIPVIVAPPTVRVSILATVSVVMIAAAAASKSASPTVPASFSRAGVSTSIGYCTPITPVDATSSSSGRTPTSSAARRRTSRALASPVGPVATLAFFEMVTIPRNAARSEVRESSTEAPAKRDRVKTAALVTGPEGAATTAKSSAPSLRPRLAVTPTNPAG